MSLYSKQIIATGNDGFIADLENPLMNLYVLAQARAKTPAVCYIGPVTRDVDRFVSARAVKAEAPAKCRPTW